MDLLCISVWYIKWSCPGALKVLWHLVVLGLSALRVLTLRLSCILGLEGILLLYIFCLSILVLCWSCFWCSPSESSPTFLQMGQFGPHPHHSAFGGAVALGVGCSCSWGSIFMGSLEFVAVTVLLVGGIGQSFFNSKRFLNIFPASGHAVLVWTGAFSTDGKLFPGVPFGKGFWPSGFTGALGFGVVAWLHCLDQAWPPPSLWQSNLFLFLVPLESFLTWGFVLGWGGLNWSDWGLRFLVPTFPLTQDRSSFS